MTINPSTFDVIIIGAGASGLFCAFHAAKYGKKTLVIDHANKAGKKILMSGGGRCNFVNTNVSAHNFISQNPHFVRSALSRFSPYHFLEYVYKHRIAFHEKSHGQLFCDHSSKDILTMLLDECHTHGVEICLNTSVLDIDKNSQSFCLTVQQKHQSAQTLLCQSLVVATGGLSIPTLGASGFGYQVALQFGHTITPKAPALVPFTFTDSIGEMTKHLSGISLDVIAFNNKASFERPMLFTHRGLSGPAMLELSSYWQLGELIHINLLPSLDVGDFLLQQKRQHPKQLIRTVLAPFFAKKLLLALETHFWQSYQDIELANIKDATLKDIGTSLNDWQLKPSGTEGYRTAEVTLGGVDTKDICSQSMQSKRQPNLYFIGEVLDVTGQLGGYNFHWAWASAFACANSL